MSEEREDVLVLMEGIVYHCICTGERGAHVTSDEQEPEGVAKAEDIGGHDNFQGGADLFGWEVGWEFNLEELKTAFEYH